MGRSFGAFAVLAMLAGLTLPVQPAAAQSRTPSGTLTCSIGTGLVAAVTTQRALTCRFRPRRGPMQIYTGAIRSFALDPKAVGRSLASWRVYGVYARAPLGALNGRYARPATGGASLVAGNTRVRLEPRALPLRRGANVAIGVTAFDLRLVRAGRPR
ncbi:DUF992 domain-containing protein [Bosea sp. TWI1241]|uniref:DUF992 domain-containing protein n=1 Tax=Bosea sp. TWI1241 TaxID=3148904 RepID=UPI00320B8A68